MTQPLLTAGEAMFRALNNLPCRCLHNVPYGGLPEPQVVTHECARCTSMAAWQMATAAISATVKAP